MKKNHLRKSFSDKGDLTLWRSIGPTNVLEFKRTSDQRRDYRENGESRARVQHDVLIRSLEKVAGETEREGERWKVKLIVFVGGTCGLVHV